MSIKQIYNKTGLKACNKWRYRKIATIIYRVKVCTRLLLLISRTSQKDDPCRNLLGPMNLFIYLFTDAAVVDDAIKFVSYKSSSIKPELEKHKVDDAATVDKKQSDYNNDIQRSEEEEDNN